MNVLLIGFKSCGKSTTGALLAPLTSRSFADADTLVEELFRRRRGETRSCREIYTRFGASCLRDMETTVLRDASRLRDTVIATGGGIVLREENTPLLRAAGLCIFLDVPLPVLERRLQGQERSPLFRDKGIAAVYRERFPLYLAAAHMRHTTRGDEAAEDLARDLARRIQEEPHGQQ